MYLISNLPVNLIPSHITGEADAVRQPNDLLVCIVALVATTVHYVNRKNSVTQVLGLPASSEWQEPLQGFRRFIKPFIPSFVKIVVVNLHFVDVSKHAASHDCYIPLAVLILSVNHLSRLQVCKATESLLFLKAKLLFRRANDVLVIDFIDEQLIGAFVNGVYDCTLKIVLYVCAVNFRRGQLADTVFERKSCQFVCLIHQLLQGTFASNLNTI